MIAAGKGPCSPGRCRTPLRFGPPSAAENVTRRVPDWLRGRSLADTNALAPSNGGEQPDLVPISQHVILARAPAIHKDQLHLLVRQG